MAPVDENWHTSEDSDIATNSMSLEARPTQLPLRLPRPPFGVSMISYERYLWLPAEWLYLHNANWRKVHDQQINNYILKLFY